jgi:hypothetical protein
MALTKAHNRMIAGEAVSAAGYNNDLAAAVTAIGSSYKTLVVGTTPSALTANLIIPANISVVWEAGCIISGAYTLTIKGGFSAGMYQVFGTTVSAVFDSDLVDHHLTWWLPENHVVDGTVDYSTHTQAAVDAITYGNLLFPGNIKILLTNIALKAGVSLIGGGRVKADQTEIKGSNAANPVFKLHGASLTFFGNTVSGFYFNAGLSTAAISLEYATNLKINNNSFHALPGNAILTNALKFSNTVEISNNYINQSALTQLELSGLGDSVIKANLIQQGFESGIIIAHASKVSENYITLNYDDGVKVVGDYTKITDNTIIYCGNNGVVVDISTGDVQGTMITSNEIYANNTDKVTAYGIHIVNGNRTMVHANHMPLTAAGPETNSVRIEAGNNGTNISNNTLFIAGGVSDASAALTTIAHNLVSGTYESLSVHSGFTLTGKIIHKTPTTVASGATITLGTDDSNILYITGTTNIDTIAGSASGEELTLIFSAVLTVGDGTGNLALAGNFVTSAGDVLKLVFRSGTGYEVSRSSN